MKQLFLFVQQGCRACTFTEVQLKKINNWEKIVDIVDLLSENGEPNELAKKYDINFTPSLIILDSTGNLIDKVVGAKKMGFDFWKSLLNRYLG